jgi:predicted metal-binding membrane protein
MLVMFGVGMSSPWLMLVLTAVMVAEKNLTAGRRFADAVGVVLLLAAAAVILL